ncbi:hypothetical protein [Spirosoma validum]|uniref:Uncharacterized protein n=1 Tax=Spirosoma validum TaxID=2771355 RepID=A0A927B1M8_9BACT|nr:hypothetical protein [Spirosoma validum]MBD2753904.1 hypothetical protein [Spirosoma validum]
MKSLFHQSFFLVLLSYAPSLSQQLYVPNERVILVINPSRREDYVAQAQKLIKPSGELNVRRSQSNPSLLLIQDPNVGRLDNPPTNIKSLGAAYFNWLEIKRSSMADTSYCVHCAGGESSMRAIKTRPDPIFRLSQSRKSDVVTMVKCCPTGIADQQNQAIFIVSKGNDKVTIAELLNEASRLTAPGHLKVVRYNSVFPTQADGLLKTFNRQLVNRNQAVLQPTPMVKKK